MSETHTKAFDYFDLTARITDDGDVFVAFVFPEPNAEFEISWDEMREVIEFVGIHGLAMKSPWLVEYSESVEGAAGDPLASTLRAVSSGSARVRG
jgi:hypothetical protein